CAKVMFAALTDTPACSYEVVRDPGWPVTLAGTLPNAVVIARLLSGARGKSIGSDHTAMPAAIVADGVPEKASALVLGVAVVLVAGGGRAARPVRLMDGRGSVAERFREAARDLRAAQRVVDALAQGQVAERGGRQVAGLGQLRRAGPGSDPVTATAGRAA